MTSAPSAMDSGAERPSSKTAAPSEMRTAPPSLLLHVPATDSNAAGSAIRRHSKSFGPLRQQTWSSDTDVARHSLSAKAPSEIANFTPLPFAMKEQSSPLTKQTKPSLFLQKPRNNSTSCARRTRVHSMDLPGPCHLTAVSDTLAACKSSMLATPPSRQICDVPPPCQAQTPSKDTAILPSASRQMPSSCFAVTAAAGAAREEADAVGGEAASS
mmetsp:Transcript_93523/g.269297  ORF Transcript_93523/g.269297 Transcript_93523/m.269297 type:complete len:214 (+) Transcript_93523:1222-1863(+)